MSTQPITTPSPKSKLLHKTRAQIDKLTNHTTHISTSTTTSTIDHILESHNDTLPEDESRQAERQEKLERLARNVSNESSASDYSVGSAPYREIEMGGARKMGVEEVGRIFD